MGYYTEYYGELDIVPALAPGDTQLINMWLSQRHVLMDEDALDTLPNFATVDGQEMGEGGWNVVTSYPGYGESVFADMVADDNDYGRICPGFWSPLEISDDGTALYWNEVGKVDSFEMEEWLKLMLEILAPLDTTLEGKLEFSGEDEDDVGHLVVIDGKVSKEYDISYY